MLAAPSLSRSHQVNIRKPAENAAAARAQRREARPDLVLEIAGRKLPPLPELKKALDTLRALADACPIPVSFDLAELRGFQDWYMRYWLQSVPGVAEVASAGGFVREYQVDVDPAKLRIGRASGLRRRPLRGE